MEIEELTLCPKLPISLKAEWEICSADKEGNTGSRPLQMQLRRILKRALRGSTKCQGLGRFFKGKLRPNQGKNSLYLKWEDLTISSQQNFRFPKEQWLLCASSSLVFQMGIFIMLPYLRFTCVCLYRGGEQKTWYF